MHSAASAGRAGVCRALLEANAPVDVRAPSGASALIFAAGKGHADVAAVLLEAGADAAASAKCGGGALHRAAARGHVGVLQMLLDRLPRDALDATDRGGHTALHLAALEAEEGACVLLAEAGATLRTQNGGGEWSTDGMPERLVAQLSD